MNTLICAIVLLIFSLLNYRQAKSLFYPPFIFSCYWGLLLLLLAVLPTSYYPLTNQTLLIFTTGIVFFSLGGLLFLKLAKATVMDYTTHTNITNESYRHYITNLLIFGIIISLLLLPLYCYRLYTIAITANFLPESFVAAHPITSFFVQLRKIVVSENGLGPFKYLTAWFSFLGLISLIEFYHYKSLKNKIVVGSYFVISLIYLLLSTARIGMISFLFSFFSLYFILNQKLKLKVIIYASIMILVAFLVPALVLHKGGATTNSSIQNIMHLLNNIKLYLLGGIVAFNEVTNYIDSLAQIFPHLYSLSFFFKIAHVFNNDIYVPKAIFPFIYMPSSTNVYTIFFSWFLDFGWVGIISICFILGFIAATCFHYAMKKNPLCMVLYACIITGLLLSNFYDAFLVGLSYWIQLFTITFLVYKVPNLANNFYILKAKYGRNTRHSHS